YQLFCFVDLGRIGDDNGAGEEILKRSRIVEASRLNFQREARQLLHPTLIVPPWILEAPHAFIDGCLQPIIDRLLVFVEPSDRSWNFHICSPRSAAFSAVRRSSRGPRSVLAPREFV